MNISNLCSISKYGLIISTNKFKPPIIMRKILPLLLLCLPTIVLSQVALDQVDDFEDYTMRNWTKNNTIPNENIYDGGPLGEGDNF